VAASLCVSSERQYDRLHSSMAGKLNPLGHDLVPPFTLGLGRTYGHLIPRDPLCQGYCGMPLWSYLAAGDMMVGRGAPTAGRSPEPVPPPSTPTLLPHWL
jgi:hypothetical protein